MLNIVVDEAALLGHQEALELGLTLGRGYGVHLAFFFQSRAQLKESFGGKEGVLLDNTEHIYFGVQSQETAEEVSKMFGQATITVESASNNTSVSRPHGGGAHGESGQTSSSWSTNHAEQARPLRTADEVRNMDGNLLIAFLRGLRPVIAKRLLWYQDAAFASQGRWRWPPRWMWWLLFSAAWLGLWWLQQNGFFR